jgi:hypothetical protein
MNCYASAIAAAVPARQFHLMAPTICPPVNAGSCPRRRAVFLAALLTWLAPRAARAENSLSYKYEDYREAGGRIAVQTRGAYLEQDLGTEMHLKLEGIVDAITGATPTGAPAPAGSDQVDTTELHPEQRKSWNADLSRQFPRINVSLGVGNSRESDYVSNGWSVNTVTDFNQKNTTLLAGLAGTDDKIKVLFQGPRARKHTNDIIVGVSQLLNPLTSVGLNLTWGRASGDLSDQYKLVQKTTEVFPGISFPLPFFENRPSYREKWIALASINRAFPEARGALEASYRFYHDTNGTDAHTVDLAWFQRLGEKFMLRPSLRLYQQSAAPFYYYQLDGTTITPSRTVPVPRGPFYSSDYRLSQLQSLTYGLKAIYNATAAWQFDVALEQYNMRGTDGVTPQSAYPRARIITAGAKFSW